MSDFGNRMKSYELKDKIISGIPFVARLDGKSFSTWTKKFKRPYDITLHNAFIDATKLLVKETHACIGYTQSDEITLVYNEDDEYFGRKIQKLCSVLSSIASASFNKQNLSDNFAYFDCRIFGVPNRGEASNAVLWRELDATKNAISSVAQHYFSHKSLHKTNSKQMQDRLWKEKNINFNDYPDFFKRGSFIQNRKYYKEEGVLRSNIIRLDMPKFSTVDNRVGVIFEKEDPIIKEK